MKRLASIAGALLMLVLAVVVIAVVYPYTNSQVSVGGINEEIHQMRCDGRGQLKIVCDGFVTDGNLPNNGAKSVEWNWGDGSSTNSAGKIYIPAEHTYVEQGNYTVTLTVIFPSGKRYVVEDQVRAK